MNPIPQRSVLNWPQGVTVYDENRCCNGYTLFAPVSSPTIYLIDMSGEVVHMWFAGDAGCSSVTHAKYLGDGRILVAANWLKVLDWDGNVVWSYRPEGPDEDPHRTSGRIPWNPQYQVGGAHHDFQRLENGNYLILASERIEENAISDHPLSSDYFVEVTPEGETVWVWHASEHFEEFGFSDEAKRLMREGPGTHMGTPSGDYLHTNTLDVLPDTPLAKRDSRFREGNILSSQRNTNTIFIVDRDSGEVVWQWGREPGQLVGQHHPNMLPNGNILVYDNGGLGGYPRETRIYTRLIEVNPLTGEIEWEYKHNPRRYFHTKFFSYSWGSAQRLPNGNTLSLDSNMGRLFEITPDGRLVWEYINQYMGMMRGATKRMETGVYRCYRIPYDEVPDFSGDFTA